MSDLSNNSIVSKLKESITLKANNWTTTLTDWCFSSFGIPIYQDMKLNDLLSNKLTSLFTNTKINVYIYISKKPNIIGFPGDISPEVLKMKQSFKGTVNDNGEVSGSISNIQSVCFDTINNIVKNQNKDGGEAKLEVIDGKFSTNIEAATFFISSNFINCFDNDDELIAIILDEFANNTRRFYNSIISKFLVNGTIGGIFGIYTWLLYTMVNDGISRDQAFRKLTNINPFTNRSEYDRLHDEWWNGNPESKWTYINILKVFCIFIISVYLIALYMRKKTQLLNDEFVIKCGYGEALQRALEKYNIYIFGNTSNSNMDAFKGFNTLDKICHFLNKMFAYLGNAINWTGITGTQSIGHRLDTIKHKTDIYDTSDTNIDRTNPIQESEEISINVANKEEDSEIKKEIKQDQTFEKNIKEIQDNHINSKLEEIWKSFLDQNPSIVRKLSGIDKNIGNASTAGSLLISNGMYDEAKQWKVYRRDQLKKLNLDIEEE